MTESQEPGQDPTQVPGEIRRPHHGHRQQNGVVAFVRRFPEVLWLFVLALGVFLLTERMNIRRGLAAYLAGAYTVVRHSFRDLEKTFGSFRARATGSDLLGLLLIIGATVAILYSLRRRLMATPDFTELQCPVCQGAIHRVHRRTLDRLINFFVPVRRYRCGGQDCRWEGLRVTSSGSVPARRGATRK